MLEIFKQMIAGMIGLSLFFILANYIGGSVGGFIFFLIVFFAIYNNILGPIFPSIINVAIITSKSKTVGLIIAIAPIFIAIIGGVLETKIGMDNILNWLSQTSINNLGYAINDNLDLAILGAFLGGILGFIGGVLEKYSHHF